MDDIAYTGILDEAWEREYAKRHKASKVITYYLSKEELEYYRNLPVEDESIDPGGKILMSLYKRQGMI